MLDEIDKSSKSVELLELLDPTQNITFFDKNLDIHLDLSSVYFICTANSVMNLPDPLLNRMKIIKFEGYSIDSKV